MLTHFSSQMTHKIIFLSCCRNSTHELHVLDFVWRAFGLFRLSIRTLLHGFLYSVFRSVGLLKTHLRNYKNRWPKAGENLCRGLCFSYVGEKKGTRISCMGKILKEKKHWCCKKRSLFWSIHPVFIPGAPHYPLVSHPLLWRIFTCRLLIKTRHTLHPWAPNVSFGVQKSAIQGKQMWVLQVLNIWYATSKQFHEVNSGWVQSELYQLFRTLVTPCASQNSN